MTAPDGHHRDPSHRTLVSILNWNGTEDTVKCLSGLDRSAAPELAFLVLDNGSDEDPTQRLSALFPDVELHRLPRNLGFTGGHNIVMRWALERGFAAVLLLNNDCEIEIGALRALHHALAADDGLGAASALIYRSGAQRIAMMVAGSIDWQQQRSLRPSDPGALSKPGQPTLLVGTALALRCQALTDIGLLDERYFAYYEDNDLSVRLAQAGWRAAYVRDAVCLHHYRPLHQYSPMALYLLTRNAWLFWDSHTPAAQRRGMRRRLLAQNLHDLALLQKNRTPVASQHALLSGIWDGLRSHFGPPPAALRAPAWFRYLLGFRPYFLSRHLAAAADSVQGTPVPSTRTRA